ncbi:DNA repair protein RadA [Porphyromonas canoris]|uniref:DNA repair protein RadA n=1 Tax=Porphyromonas canoris TaxID=36875 RepID=A0ABR4XKQ7_9PORP|nr:DNA repair protein RadA [Porphyromonas canoris]KGN92238.1 DNA repair protein RadA [Porphyromonas canoris]
MGKNVDKVIFLCKECGNEFSKWSGKCPMCGAWNTLSEYKVKDTPHVLRGISPNKENSSFKILKEVSGKEAGRLDLKDKELNRVLGGGLVKGSIVLIAGEPGIGKSTLILQSLLNTKEIRTLYVSGEESERQIKLRADRVVATIPHENFLIYCETHLEKILDVCKEASPDLIVIDSIQTIFTEQIDSSPGSLTQVRECATRLMTYAKNTDIPILFIGHITKDGSIAGPKILEHLVDTVLQFEGDTNYQYRLLRANKNRFGSTSEIGIYEMRQNGLRGVENPSELLITRREEQLSGICVGCAMEGARPILIEIQSLVSSAVYGTPQRSSTGVDGKRMNMLLAVLEKRAGFKLIQKDVFLNITGGLKLSDTALDLSILAAVLSSNLDLPIPTNICVAGEVGLSGEIRPISRIEQRVGEAQRIGFETIIIPTQNLQGIDLNKYKIKVVGVSRVDQAFNFLFRGR